MSSSSVLAPIHAFRVTTGGELAPSDIQPPELHPNFVRVEVAGCAVDRFDASAPIGAVPGGSIAGRVVLGGANTQEWVGREVVVPPWFPCLECDLCRRARGVVCSHGVTLGKDLAGGFATHVDVPTRPLLPLTGPLVRTETSPPLAAFALLSRLGALGYAAYTRLAVSAGDWVAILGANPLARVVARVLRAKGAKIAVFANRATDRELLSADADLVTAFEPVVPADFPAIFRWVDTVGSAGSIELFAALALPTATLATLAPKATHDGRDPVFSLHHLQERELTVTAISACHPDLLPELAALVLRGELAIGDLWSPIARTELPAAFLRLRSAGASDLKIEIATS